MTIRSLPSPSILLSPPKPPVRAHAIRSETASNPYKSSNHSSAYILWPSTSFPSSPRRERRSEQHQFWFFPKINRRRHRRNSNSSGGRVTLSISPLFRRRRPPSHHLRPPLPAPLAW
ncbi:hypothetical protein EJB05_37582, partial [Eragrostis curvula]